MDSKFDDYLKKFNRYLDDIEENNDNSGDNSSQVINPVQPQRVIDNVEQTVMNQTTYHQNRTDRYQKEILQLQHKIRTQQEKMDKMIDLSKAILVVNNKLTIKLEKSTNHKEILAKDCAKYKQIIKQIQMLTEEEK